MKSILPEQLKKNTNGIIMAVAVRETLDGGPAGLGFEGLVKLDRARTARTESLGRSTVVWLVINIKNQIKQKMV